MKHMNIQTKRGSNTKSQQPCWECKKAVFGCDWSREFKPIEGWIANYIPTSAGVIDTYDIKFCPEFERE